MLLNVSKFDELSYHTVDIWKSCPSVRSSLPTRPSFIFISCPYSQVLYTSDVEKYAFIQQLSMHHWWSRLLVSRNICFMIGMVLLFFVRTGLLLSKFDTFTGYMTLIWSAPLACIADTYVIYGWGRNHLHTYPYNTRLRFKNWPEMNADRSFRVGFTYNGFSACSFWSF